jgi:hypothetical protein
LNQHANLSRELVSIASILEEWKTMNVTAPRFVCSAKTPVQFAATGDEETLPQIQPGEFLRHFGLTEPLSLGINLEKEPTPRIGDAFRSTKRFFRFDDGKKVLTDVPEVIDDKKQPRFGCNAHTPVQFAGKKNPGPLPTAVLLGLLSTTGSWPANAEFTMQNAIPAQSEHIMTMQASPEQKPNGHLTLSELAGTAIGGLAIGGLIVGPLLRMAGWTREGRDSK